MMQIFLLVNEIHSLFLPAPSPRVAFAPGLSVPAARTPPVTRPGPGPTVTGPKHNNNNNECLLSRDRDLDRRSRDLNTIILIMTASCHETGTWTDGHGT